MNKKFYTLLIISTLTITFAHTQACIDDYKPIMSNRTKTLSLGTGLGISAATAWGIHTLFSDILEGPIAIGVASAVTALAGLFGAKIVYDTQPEGLFEHAQATLCRLAERNDLLYIKLSESTDLMHTIDATFIHHTYPRLHAYRTLQHDHYMARKAIHKLKAVIKGSSDTLLTEAAQTYLIEAKSKCALIEPMIITIKNDPLFIEQMKAYEAHLARIAQEDAAWAARWNSLNNGWWHHNHCWHARPCITIYS